jgi:hypothetical protein
MLVPSMTEKEALDQVMNDFSRVQRSTQRWVKEYFKERSKLKISRDLIYPKSYKAKYNNRNPWVTVMFKPEEEAKIRDRVAFYSYTWYQSAIGLRVFAIAHQTVSIYNGHLFGRYSERLNLGLETPLKKVEHFFEHNRVLAPTEYEKDGHKCLVGVCPTGYILGEQREDLECNVFKTFIARSNAGPRLSSLRDDLLASLDALESQEHYPLSPQQAPHSDSMKARLRLALTGL